MVAFLWWRYFTFFMLSRVWPQRGGLTLPLCRQCARKLVRRQSSAAVQVEPPSASVLDVGDDSKSYRLLAATILNRSPLLTCLPTPFESAYFEYQRRIARALSNPFPGEFYFKKGSFAERKFTAEEREREIAAFGSAARVKAVEEGGDENYEQEVEEKPLPRETDADRQGDVKSLDRKGDCNLYLLLKVGKDETWRFPQGEVLKGEALHKAALRDLHDECGSDMQAWLVGRQPIAVCDSVRSPRTNTAQTDKIFFFKGHIMAGQARPNSAQITDFAWLTKEEIEERVERSYWEAVKDVLSNP